MKNCPKLGALCVAILGMVIQLHIFTTYGMGLDWLCVVIGAWLSLYALCTINMGVMVWRYTRAKKPSKRNTARKQNFFIKL
jgi:hypothetical protein